MTSGDERVVGGLGALIAQLPHSPAPRPDLAARWHVANTLRALAVRLDPTAGQEPALATATSR